MVFAMAEEVAEAEKIGCTRRNVRWRDVQNRAGLVVLLHWGKRLGKGRNRSSVGRRGRRAPLGGLVGGFGGILFLGLVDGAGGVAAEEKGEAAEQAELGATIAV